MRGVILVAFLAIIIGALAGSRVCWVLTALWLIAWADPICGRKPFPSGPTDNEPAGSLEKGLE